MRRRFGKQFVKGILPELLLILAAKRLHLEIGRQLDAAGMLHHGRVMQVDGDLAFLVEELRHVAADEEVAGHEEAFAGGSADRPLDGGATTRGLS